MDYKRIEALLDKYWEAETTLEEEQELLQFFNDGEVPEHLQEAAQVFRYFANQKKPVIEDPAFDEKVVGIHETVEIPKRGKVIKWDFKRMLNVAAAIGGVVVASIIIRNQTMIEQTPDTFEDPKLAFEETKKALELLSSKQRKRRSHEDSDH